MSSRKSSDCEVYNQYQGTNLDLFIKKYCESYREATAPYHELYTQVNNLALATGNVLDEFGRTLSFNRYITFNDPLDVVREGSDGIDEYLVITQRDNDIYKQCRLNDKAFRTVLRLLVESRNTVSSVTSLSKIISDIVDADVFVGDSFNMQYITYYFLDRIPGWLEVTMHNFDILPRPAGMSAEYISAFSRFFGLLIEDPFPDKEATAKVFSAFWKARFPTVTPKVTIRTNQEVATRVPYNPAVPQDAIKYLFHLYNVSRTAQEVKIRDDFRSTLQLMEESVTNDHKYMYMPPHLQGTMFPAFSTPLTTPDLDDTQVIEKIWEAKAQALKTWEADQDKWRERLHNRLHYNEKKDPRHGLFFDHTTGWYYHKDKDATTNQFDPYFLANLYQDRCALWFPVDDLYTQVEKGHVLLRTRDYLDTQRTHKLDTSPYIELFSQAVQQAEAKNQEIIDEDKAKASRNQGDELMGMIDRGGGVPSRYPQDMPVQRLRRLLDNLHQGITIYSRIIEFAKRSFRACLEMEYQAASLIQYRNHMRDNVLSRTSYKTKREQQYWRDIVDRLTKYYGYCNSYRNFWNDYDTNSPAYKRRIFLRTQRYLVMEAKNKLSSLYSDNATLYSQLQQDGVTLDTKVYSILSQLRDEVGGEYFTDIESARNGFGLDEGYSSINLKNTELPYYETNFTNDYNDKAEKTKWNRTAGDACWRLMEKCKNNQSMDGDEWYSFACYTIPNFTSIPKYGNMSDGNQSWDKGGHYYIGWAGNRRRGCKVSGYRSFEDGWRAHGAEYGTFKSREDEALKRLRSIQAEINNRTVVTHERTLREVMRYYNSYVPSQVAPKPPDPDISIEYPDYSQVDWAQQEPATDLL